MNRTLRTLAGLSLVLPFAAGCAGRTAPFDELDKAPITIMRLQQEPPPAAAPTPGSPTTLIPGIPPELQQLGQQAAQGLQSVLPPGLIPPGLIPGSQPTAQQPVAQQLPHFKSFVIVGQPIQLNNDDVHDQILDIFGSEDSFQADHPNCFSAGMGISIARNAAPPVDLLVSFSCNQAQGDGFRWPYKSNGFTQDTYSSLSKIYQTVFGQPVPPGA